MIWFFVRAGERLRYEIRRNAAAQAYELAIVFPDGRAETEQTADAADLLRRCTERARALKSDGWRAAER